MLTLAVLLESLQKTNGHTNDNTRLPVRFFKALLPADVFDDFLYSDDEQTLGRLRELMAARQ